jgi:hypothetical protein
VKPGTSALNLELFGGNLYKGPNCNRQIRVTNPSNGNEVAVKVVDACQDCALSDLDLSANAFGQLA